MYTQEISRGLSLTLAQRLAEIPGLASALSAEAKDSVKDELDVLRRFAGQGDDTPEDALSGLARRPRQDSLLDPASPGQRQMHRR